MILKMFTDFLYQISIADKIVGAVLTANRSADRSRLKPLLHQIGLIPARIKPEIYKNLWTTLSCRSGIYQRANGTQAEVSY
jgi:hypothetical protein